MFAAFFGFGVSRALHVYNVTRAEQMTTTRSSNIFSLMGTLFLWIFWPSFMSSGAQPGQSEGEMREMRLSVQAGPSREP